MTYKRLEADHKVGRLWNQFSSRIPMTSQREAMTERLLRVTNDCGNEKQKIYDARFLTDWSSWKCHRDGFSRTHLVLWEKVNEIADTASQNNCWGQDCSITSSNVNYVVIRMCFLLNILHRKDENFHGLTLTHWGQVTHICIGNLAIISSDNGWSPWSVPSHYLIQCWNIVWTLRNKFQWNFNQNSYIFIQENSFENAVC